MWLVMTIACICAVGYQIYERVSFFGSWPVNVNVEINYNKTLKFPAVTICNQNSFRATKAAELGLYDLIEDVFSKSAVSPVEVIRRNNASNITIADLFVNLGHDKHDLFVSCRWKNSDCGPEDFISVLTDHGLCYTFSPNSSEMAISAPGIDSGLQLMLNIEQYEYMNGPHDSAGVKVFLHDPEQTPLVASLGQAVSTGFSAFAGINLLTIEYQPPPYGDCGSKLLNHTTLYTAEECFLDCMTAVVTEKCGCRDMYMNTNGSDGPAICNLLQYFNCVKGAKDEFYGMFEHRCECPVSCEVTIFDPTFSDGSLSNHAVNSLLTSNLSSSLYWKLLEASETKALMDKRKQKELRNLFEPLNETYTKFNERLRVLPAYLDDMNKILYQNSEEFDDIYRYIVWLRNCQSYVFSVGFLQDKDAVSNYLSESTNEFLIVWHKRIERLLNMSESLDSNKECIYNQMVEDLQTRKHLINNAKDDITSLFQSFSEEAISHDILFSGLNQSNIKLCVPKSEIKEALSYDNGDHPLSETFQYCKKEIIHLYRNLSAIVDQLTDLTENAYRTPDDDTLFPVFTNMMTKYTTATIESKTCRDILNDMLFRRPLLSLEAKKDDTARQRKKFYDAMTKIYQTFYQLEEIFNNSISIMNSSFKSFIDMTYDLVESKQHSMTSVFFVFSSESTQSAINKLKEFSFEVDTRQQAIYSNFLDLHIFAHSSLMAMINSGDELLGAYYNLFKKELFLQNPTEFYFAFNNRIIHDPLDIRELFGNIDHDLVNAIGDLAQYLDKFNKSVSINSIFLRENFLKLNVFYRQLSYEYIRQQKGYDIFALICDIGGSMGLFIGASMLTVVEVIDLLLGQTPVFMKKTKLKQKKSHSSDTSVY